jgi:hypothetical protein
MKRDDNGTNFNRRGTKPGSIRSVRLRLWWDIQEAVELPDAPEAEGVQRLLH